MITVKNNAFTLVGKMGRRMTSGMTPRTARTAAIALTVAVLAALLPAALTSEPVGAVGPPSGCELSNAFEPSFVGNTRVAFSAVDNQGAPGVRQIFVANLDGTSRNEIASESAGTDPLGSRDPAGSPDGTKVAWDGLAASRQIYVSNPDGTSRVTASATEAPDPGSNRHPRWSGDSTKITWYGNDGSGDRQIYVSDPDGTNKDEISSGAGATIDNERPVLNHDASKVAWSGVTETGLTGSISATATGTVVTGVGTMFVTEGVMVGDLIRLGSEERVVASVSNELSLTVTAAFIIGGTDGTPERLRREIYIANVNGSSRSVISSAGVAPLTNNSYPDFSNDGTRIVWSGFDGDNQLIYTDDVATTTSQTEIVTPGEGDGGDPTENIKPRFKPTDSSQIIWIGRQATGINSNQVWLADADGSSRRDITNTINNDPSGNHDAVWSPDGLNVAWWGIREDGKQVFVETLSTGDRVEISIVDDVALCGAPPTTTTTTTVPGTPSTTTTSLPPGAPDCPTANTPFTDVSPTSFATDDIKCIYGLGITTGTSPTTYGPAEDVTREQMAAFLGRLWRTAGGTCPTADTPFTDVSATSFAKDDVKCIYGLGITTGTSPTTYGPAEDVTREQMAAFLGRVWRAAGGTCSTTPAPFTDVASNSFAKADIDCIYDLGITTGTSATTYGPKNNVTREQMAAFLGRLYRKMLEL
jgi:Tol biopolymer transport system component